MKITMKILLGVMGAVILVAAAAIIFITLIVDPNDYREDISSLVKQQTGRELDISGDLELTFFPWLGVRTGRLDLSNPPAFGDASMLTVEQAEIRVKLLPLLQSKLEVDTIVLVEPVVHLVVAADGVSNWQDLSAQGSRDPSEPAGVMGALAIQGIDLTRGKLIWEDRQSGSTYVLREVGLATGEILGGQPAGVELGFVYDAEDLDHPVSMNLNSTVRLDLDHELVEVTDLALQGNYGPSASADVKFDALTIDLARSTINTEQLDLDGTYASADLVSPIAAKIKTGLNANLTDGVVDLAGTAAQVTYGTVNADVGAKTLRYDPGRATIAATTLTLDGIYETHEIQTVLPTVSANIDQQQINLPDFTAVVDGVEANLDLELAEFLGNAKYSGRLVTKAFKPADLLARFALDFASADPGALAGARLSTVFEGGLNRVKLDELSFQLDDTLLQGFMEIERFVEPKIRFDIDIDEIDVDRYAPAGGEPVETGAAVVVLPVGLFRQLDANGELKIARLKVSGVRMTDIDIGVASTAEGMTVKPMNANLYGGTMQGEMQFVEVNDTAVLNIRQVMEQVDIGPLLADTGVTDRLAGKGRLALDIRAEEVNGQPKTRGNADFHFYDGAVRGFDLRKIYLQARQIYNQQRGKEQAVATDDREEFKFTEMTGTLAFDEKSASNGDLLIKSPLFRITGEGTADLSANRLDYLVNATVVESAKGQGGEELSDLKGVTLPIRITGALESPVYRLDVGKLLQGVVREQVNKETEKLEKKLEEKLGNELQKLLKIN